MTLGVLPMATDSRRRLGKTNSFVCGPVPIFPARLVISQMVKQVILNDDACGNSKTAPKDNLHADMYSTSYCFTLNAAR